MKNIIVALTPLVFCGAVLASEADATTKRITLTISPLHLFAPIVEINGEFKASDNLGVALIAGVGNQSSLGGDTYSVSEYGIQVNYYSGSNFNQGVQYGVELMKINVELDSSSSTNQRQFDHHQNHLVLETRILLRLILLWKTLST